VKDAARMIAEAEEEEGRKGILLQAVAGGFTLPRRQHGAGERFFTFPEIKELLATPGLLPAADRDVLLAYLRRQGCFWVASPQRPGIVGVIGRFRPLHSGHDLLLRTLCGMAGRLRIGIGSANRYGRRNPFTAEETREMIDAVLAGCDFEVVPLADFGHRPEYADGSRWRQQVAEAFAGCEWIVSGNHYVASLLAPCFRVLHPIEVLPAGVAGETLALSSSQVRRAMAAGGEWRHLVPAAVARYLEGNGLVARLRREFPPQEEGDEACGPERLRGQQARIREA
jgi:nicotinamide-nucleotide adenylyltransferase